ncbi:Inorganic phosphate transporter pho84 [Ceratobasidium sp. 394]|nr:Inorganic phosphate transporter pho84 [Ceratobasidium sp. 394]KAG9079122.1 Inorganic phosphate transporter pho84 [Ceratobasidium sp. UAMH 11750]
MSATTDNEQTPLLNQNRDSQSPIPSKQNRDETGKTYEERRRAALREIDEAKLSWFHVKACLISGIGFFTDAYDIFAINIASTMIGYVYNSKHALYPNQELGIKVATPLGTLFGQLLFGWLADVVGRKKMYGVELIIIIIGTFAQAVSSNTPAVSIISTLIVWRFIMGIGIGGDYPLSAVITSEFAATRIRGRMMTAVFGMQGFGNFTAALVALVVTESYKSKIMNETETYAAVDHCWRLLIGLGAVPGVAALYFRLTIPETPRYAMDVERNVQQVTQGTNNAPAAGTSKVDQGASIERASAPKASWVDFCQHFGKWKNGKVLLGTAYSWMALDIAFYGLGLNNSNVLMAIGFGDSPGPNVLGRGIYHTLHNVSVGNLILSAGGYIPGYWVTFLFIDHWGRKPIQLMGFALLTIIFLSMGFGYDAMVHPPAPPNQAFVFLYCLANFFQNFGPNTTTFIVPGEAFPTRFRSTAHGISAASGKFGAILAQVGFAWLRHDDSSPDGAFVKRILQTFALFMLSGVFSTLIIEETKGRSLEDLSNESQDSLVSEGATSPQELRDGAARGQ